MMMNNNNFIFLPPDITIDILSRLPIESVLQCKRVCRTWQAVINDPLFCEQQKKKNSGGADNTNNNTSFDFLLCTSNKGLFEYSLGEYIIHHCSSSGKENKEKSSSTFRHKKPISLLSFPLDDEHSHNYKQKYLLPVDSYNGLICLVSTFTDDYNMCVYNPHTREYVNLLPRFNIINNGIGTSSKMSSEIATGFGYHPGTKEYKIVRIYYENPYSSGQVSVYTLGSGGWRSKGKTSHRLYSGGRCSGVFANGALHWLAKKMLDDQENNTYIVSFDLVDEEFRIIPSPPSDEVHDIQLGVLDGYLSAIGTIPRYSRCLSNVWIMKHKSHKNYFWCKKYYYIPWNQPDSTLQNRKRNEPAGHSNREPLAMFEVGGKLLLHYSYMKIFFCYDPKAGSIDHVRTTNLVNSYNLIPYMKSYVSLKALGEDGARLGRTAAADNLQQLVICRKRKRTWF